MSWHPHLKPNVGPFSKTLKKLFPSALPFTKWDILNPPPPSRSTTQPPSGLQTNKLSNRSPIPWSWGIIGYRTVWLKNNSESIGGLAIPISGDYFTKHFPPSYHRSTRSTFLQHANHVSSLKFYEGVLIPSRDSFMNGMIPPRDSSMSGLIHHNPCLGLRHDWAQNLMSQHNSKHKEPSRAH